VFFYPEPLEMPTCELSPGDGLCRPRRKGYGLSKDGVLLQPSGHDFLGLSEDIKTLPICVGLRKQGTPISSHDHNLIFAIQLPSLVGKSWYKSSIFRQTIEI